MVSFDDGFDQYYEEKAVEFFLVTTSIIYFALLIPTIVDVFEDKSVKERI